MVAVLPPHEHAIASDDIVDGRYRIRHKLATGGMGTVFLLSLIHI